MRKIIGATFVASLVLATSAFAASFEVDEAVLASGTGDVSSCTQDDVRTTWELNDDYDPVVEDRTLSRLTIGAGQACAGNNWTATLLDENGDVIGAQSGELTGNGRGIALARRFDAGVVRVSDIGGVHVLIRDN